MPAFASKHSASLLIGIGLVLIGLLAGILAMLYVDEEYVAAGPRVVERVELGRAPAGEVFASTDSSAPPAVDLSRLNRLFRSVARRVTPSVVYVQVRTGGAFRTQDGEHVPPFFRPPHRSVGSGVVISRDGHIVTNRHVIAGADAIRVTLADKRHFEARVVGVDAATDLAVIKIDAETTPIALGNSDEVQVGEWVIAVGNPFRLTSTVTAGIVSALGRQVGIIEGDFSIENFIQTDAAINPGNSGGALVNLQGELVGIATAIATESGSYEGYGFAVPVNLVRRVARDLIAYGEVRRGYLGIAISDVDARLAERLGLDRIGGVYVEDVRAGAAADQAGLQSGDVVLAVEGRRVNATNELQSAVARHAPGEHIDVVVWRAGRRLAFTVELDGEDEEWVDQITRDVPSTPPADTDSDAPLFELEAWGMGVRPVTRHEREVFEVAAGVYLAYVRKGSPAGQAGLPRDVVLTHVGGRAVASVEELLRVLEEDETQRAALLRVERRDGVTAFYEIEIP